MTWAIILAVTSAAFYAGAAVLQEHWARCSRGAGAYCAGAIGLTVLGGTTHVAALGLGTVAVVQALSTLTLLLGLLFKAARDQTPIPLPAWRNAGSTVAGLAVLMCLVKESGTATTPSDAWLPLALGGAAVAVVLSWLAWRVGASPTRSLFLAAASGVGYGVVSVLIKLTTTSFSVMVAATVVVLAAASYLLGQLSYRGGLAAPLAMVSLANPVVAASLGFMFLGDDFRFGTVGAEFAMAAAVLAGIGVVGLARGGSSPSAAQAEPCVGPPDPALTTETPRPADMPRICADQPALELRWAQWPSSTERSLASWSAVTPAASK